ncbi:MAG: amidohydrolase [Candidatus Kapabacteria bacterium]|nr:amidohydrolase [Candidatus Kapabacteria bacterium]MCX7937387.1 amidohydrolase [Chlorobiota bacterium]
MPACYQGELTIQRGKIVSVAESKGGVTLIIDGKRKEIPDAWVLPGLVDAHAHVVGLGIACREGYLYGANSKQECIERILQANIYRDGWIVARGWNQELWSPALFPTRWDLDEYFPDTPVVLFRVDGHAVWVNTKVLNIASITQSTPDPVGGAILRNSDGEPTGILIDAAADLVTEYIPRLSLTEIEHAIIQALFLCSQAGLTEIHDMDVLPEDLPIFTRLAEEGKLPCRVLSWVRGQHYEWRDHGILPTVGEFHRVVGVKFFADGALGSRGAALLEPYSDEPSNSGLLLLTKEELVERFKCVIEDGFSSIAVHAIGDRAVRTVLDAFESLHTLYPSLDDIRFRIEHSQIVHPDDMRRYASLGAIASVQPIHCTSDAQMAEQRLGARVCNSYRWRSFLEHGVLLCAGSDFPVESYNPLLGIEAFCRRVPTARQESWQPQECISIVDAVDAYTINAHRAADMSYRRGRIAPGMDADITILDRNIYACPLEELSQARTLATVVGGKLYEHA